MLHEIINCSIHKLRLTVTDGGFNLNYIDVVSSSISGINVEEVEDITIYPTYFKDEAQIKVTSLKSTSLLLKIVDNEGKEVYKSDEHTTNETFSLGSDLTQGMYIVYFIYGDKVTVSKITKL